MGLTISFSLLYLGRKVEEPDATLDTPFPSSVPFTSLHHSLFDSFFLLFGCIDVVEEGVSGVPLAVIGLCGQNCLHPFPMEMKRFF